MYKASEWLGELLAQSWLQWAQSSKLNQRERGKGRGEGWGGGERGGAREMEGREKERWR